MKKLFILLWIPVFLPGCAPEFGEEPEDAKIQLSNEELELRKSMEQLAYEIAWFADDKQVQEEVFQLAQLGYEMSSRVLFKHVIEEPDQRSPALKNTVRGAVKKHLVNDAALMQHRRAGAEKPLSVQYLLDNNLEIYWPYWQEWDREKIPTITFNPFDNEKESRGFRLRVLPDGTREMETVTVSDDYAFEHPVWIIDRHEHLPAAHPLYDVFANDAGMEKLQYARTMAASDGEQDVNRIYIRHVRLTRNFRGLFGGDNRIVFHVADENVALGDSPYQSSFIIDRWAARKGVWREPNQLLKFNWKPYEVSNYFILEGIRSGRNSEFTISGSIRLSAKISDGQLELGPDINLFGWSIGINRKNEVMALYEMERAQFFAENWTNAYRYGMHEGCAVRMGSYRRGTIYYTLDADGYDY